MINIKALCKKEKQYKVFLFFVFSGLCETYYVDQAGFELTGICLSLPPPLL